MKTEKSINWSVNQIDNFKYANIHFYSEFILMVKYVRTLLGLKLTCVLNCFALREAAC